MFWSIDALSQIGGSGGGGGTRRVESTIVPTLSQLRPSESGAPSPPAIAGRSCAYLGSAAGALYVASGTEPVVLTFFLICSSMQTYLIAPKALASPRIHALALKFPLLITLPGCLHSQ